MFGNIKVRGWRERLRELLALTQETNSLWEETITRNDLACELLDDGDAEAASAELARALEVALRIEGPNSFVLAIVYCTRADIDLGLGDPRAALADTQRSRALLESINDPNPYVTSANVRAEVQAYAALGELDDAERVGHEALALLGDHVLRSRSQILATLPRPCGQAAVLSRRTTRWRAPRSWSARPSPRSLSCSLTWRRPRAEPAQPAAESAGAAIRNRGLADAQTELERARQAGRTPGQLIEQADRDWLTGLRNRRYLARALGHTASEDLTAPLSVAVLDLDHFKQINDRCGHAAGDQVLVRVASLLEARRRETHDVVVRSGGEEFLDRDATDRRARCRRLLRADALRDLRGDLGRD